MAPPHSPTQPEQAATNSKEQLQTIHSRYVSDPKHLSQLLKDSYGPGNYTVEVRRLEVISSGAESANIIFR